MIRLSSFRGRILLLVLAVTLLPMVLLGWWIRGSAARSGEALLRDSLAALLETHAGSVAERWMTHRSALLDLGDDPEVQAWLTTPDAAEPFASAARLATRLSPGVGGVTLHRAAGDSLVLRTAHEGRQGGGVRVELPVYRTGSATRLGYIDAFVHLPPLLAQQPAGSWIRGASLEAVDRRSGRGVLTGALEPGLLSQSSFVLLDEQWVAARRALPDLPVDLVAAAPLTPMIEPLRAVSRHALILLLAAGLTALLLAIVLTRRLTISLAQLAAAAEDIARGDLGRRIDPRGDDEIARVSRAFDQMTGSLRSTLDQLARNESMAAVGEFAAELAHEVRNPLTALRLDLQIVQERLPTDSPMRRVQQAALEQVDRLERAVSGALQLARSGRFDMRPLPLLPLVKSAIHSATPAVQKRGARVDVRGDDTVSVVGDEDAIQRMLLNLIINAAQAVAPGGRIELCYSRMNAHVVVTIRDDGEGISADRLEQLRTPSPAGRSSGTGLGLGIARRIVAAHDGSFDIDSTPGTGTTVTVRLPAA